MSKDFSFDIVSELDMNEMDNAINMARKEIANRFDFKGSIAEINRTDNTIELLADNDIRIKNLLDIIENKMIKRDLHIKFLDPQKIQDSLGGNVKQTILIKQGLSKEKLKEINKFIKDNKLKVKTQIIDDKLKVFSPKKDELQETMKLLQNQDFEVVLQFDNYR
jgi:cyclic-di-GMP-binding protein